MVALEHHDLRMAFLLEGLEDGVHVELSEASAEVLVLVSSDVLVPEEEHLVL